jgi:hypothetical protein
MNKEEIIIDSYTLDPLESKLGLNGIEVVADIHGTRVIVNTTNIITSRRNKQKVEKNIDGK